ncbi:MAG: hypothetical protein ACE5IJ_05495 [Thermoplasmata archaeon]
MNRDAETQALTFRVHGSVFRFESNNQELLVEARRDFGRYACVSTRADGSVSLTRMEQNFPISVPPRAIRDSFGPNESAIFTEAGRRYVTAGDRCIIRVDLSGRTVDGYCKPEYPVWPLLRTILKWFVLKKLEQNGIYFLHASGGVQDDRCILFVAPSGFGKTSALMSLLEEGYRMVTDDSVLCDGVAFYPFHTRSMIHTDMPNRFPIIQQALDHPSTSAREGGWHVDLENLFKAVHEPFVPDKLTLIHLYVWNSPATEWTWVKAKQMVAKMCHAYFLELASSLWFGWEREKAARRVFEMYFQLTRRAASYEMHAGWDLKGFSESLLSLIDSAARREPP